MHLAASPLSTRLLTEQPGGQGRRRQKLSHLTLGVVADHVGQLPRLAVSVLHREVRRRVRHALPDVNDRQIAAEPRGDLRRVAQHRPAGLRVVDGYEDALHERIMPSRTHGVESRVQGRRRDIGGRLSGPVSWASGSGKRIFTEYTPESSDVRTLSPLLLKTPSILALVGWTVAVNPASPRARPISTMRCISSVPTPLALPLVADDEGDVGEPRGGIDVVAGDGEDVRCGS